METAEQQVETFHLVRRRRSAYIHTSECRHATNGGSRWVWADLNPTEDWAKTAPWLTPCARCNPPSPFKPEAPNAQ